MLVSDVRSRIPKVVVGDFKERPEVELRTRGTVFCSRLSLSYTWYIFTFQGTGSDLIVDFTYVITLVWRMVWLVIQHYNHSDHQAIFFEIENGDDIGFCGAGNLKGMHS